MIIICMKELAQIFSILKLYNKKNQKGPLGWIDSTRHTNMTRNVFVD